MENTNGGNEMSGNIGTGDAGVLALLADTARAGRGGYGGGWGGEGGGFGLGVAGPVFQHSQDSIKQKVEDANDCNRDIFAQGMASIASSFENQTRAGQFNRICDKLGEIDQRNTDNQFRAELRLTSQIAALKEQQAKDAAASALCCCKLEAQAEQNTAKIIAEMKDIETRNVRDKLDVERSQRIAEQTRNICGCGCGGGVRPCPPQ